MASGSGLSACARCPVTRSVAYAPPATSATATTAVSAIIARRRVIVNLLRMSEGSRVLGDRLQVTRGKRLPQHYEVRPMLQPVRALVQHRVVRCGRVRSTPAHPCEGR